MALKFPDRLESNNPSAYGIVKAVEVAGHKTVSSLSALCNVPDCILSVSGNNTDNDAIGQLWYVADEGKIYQLTDWENRKSAEGWYEYGAENVTKDELEEALEKKQDKLIPGTGIEITEDNVINCTLDTKIFKFVDELPPLTEAEENKIYLVPKEENVGENQVYVEYVVVNTIDESGFPSREWEKIGEYDLGIELAPYLKIKDAEATYVKKTDIVNTLEGGTEEQVLGAQMGAELKTQIDQLREDTVHSVTATPEKGIIIEGTKNDPTVGILRDPESEEFLTLGETGLGVKGVQEAIDLGDNTVREEYKADLEEMQSHTEYLYDINSLFPEQGQGDAKDRWTIIRALTKLDSILSEEDRKSGIKMKFINSDGEWVTYTFYGGDLLNEDNWAYDLTSKDFTELASQIPVATPDSNGMMSAEDKKKFDELKEGIEDGRSILDEITDAVQEAKDVIDAYTVNGYEISSNPVLGKADVGLDQVDNTSDMDKPVSTAQQEAHDKLQSHTEYLYNINTLYPGEGEGDNSDQWNLQSAIVRLDASIPDEEKVAGIKTKFLTLDGKWRTYTFYGGSFTSPDSWSYDITSEDFEELATTDLPTATQDANGTMSKEDKKKFDTLSEGIEDGVSIVDKINEIVGENKEIIDNYTVNGYKISENPVLNKADIGLGNVDNTSDMDKPVSTAQQELLDQTKETIDNYTVNGYKISENPVLGKADVGLDQVDNTSDLDKPISNATQAKFDELESHTEILYNINETFPGEGSGENKDQWNLQTAIARLDAILDPEQEKEGIKIKFITEDGNWRTYTYYGKEGDSISNTDLWKYDLTSQDFEELATTNLPTATQEANGTMSKEDKKILDTLSEGMEEGVSIIDKIDEKVEEAKYIIDNYTVNGYKISENPVLNKADVGLSEVTNDPQVRRDEMGVQNGVATLDENGKVPTNQLPDAVLGNVKYMGIWDASINDPSLENGHEEQNGFYYIVSVPGNQFGYDFDAGDWVINSNGTWSKVDNVDAVKSVNGQTGIVELKIENIPDLRSELDQKVNITDFDQTIQDLKDSTDTLYNVTELFQGEGQTGENNEQWDLQHAISKLDGTLGVEEKIAGIKIKFIDEEGDWVTYTFNGGDFVSPSSWSYDLTSNDIDNLAELIPTATQESNGTMSKEDKKLLDTLAEGFEDGESIEDKINEIVQDAKNTIDNYTVNGYKISENPTLVKADVGLDQVDNTADLDKPVSTATQELVDQTKATIDSYTVNGYAISTNPVLTKSDVGLGNVDNTADLDKPISTATKEALDTIEDETDLVYNINKLFPEDGQGDNTDIWTIQTALSKAEGFIPAENRVPGTKVKFLDENGKWRTYTFYGGAFAEPSNWNYDLTSKDFEELATTNLPTATQEANGTMSKEDKKILDTLAEGFDGETSIADQITEKVEEAKTELQETIDTTKQELQDNINSTKEELQGNIDKTNEDLTNHIGDLNNPHQVTKEQVGLGNVTNDAQVKRDEMGVPNGVPTLDENGRIPVEQIQERQLNNVKYIGLWSAASNEPLLENNTPERSGDYYVVNTAGEQLGIQFNIGDWIINNGGTWQKVDNTESVTSVNGKIGDVTVEISDIPGLVDELDSKADNIDFEALKNRVTEIDNSIGQPSGLATLDGDGQLVQTQIPEEAINVLEGILVNETTFNDVEGEALAHQKNTIYVDTVTGKIYRWSESSYKELATISGITEDLQEHINDKNNPHEVTSEQVGLGNVTNDAQVKRDEMGIAGGVATLNENGKIPVEQLPGQVDEVFGIDHFVSTKSDIPTSRLVVGTTYYVGDEKKIYTVISETELDAGKTPEKGVIYSNRDTNLIYRWDGAELVEIGNPVTIGETPGTAYPGDKGKETTDKLNEHLADFENPHQVTKEQVGLGNVENLAPSDLPISEATQEALDDLKNTVDNYTVNGYKISENPVLVKADVGLDRVDNTNDLEKPISNATQAAIDKLNEDLSRTINTHIDNVNNPHKVTKEQVGLANVDNTADVNKPVSIAQQAALDAVDQRLSSSIGEVSTKVTNHIEDKNNPHQVTKAQVGLDQVDNTSDLNKPVSTAQQTAINLAKEELQKVIDTNKATIDNYTVSGHKISENPVLTKEDVGLGNVDNTADIDKPISHFVQDALDALKTSSDAGLNAHISDTNNPHKVTKEQVGLGNVTDDAQVKRSEMGVAGGVATLDENGQVPSSQLPAFVDEIIEADSLDTLPNPGETGKIYVTKNDNKTYRWSGSQYVEISASLVLGETSETAYPGDKGKETTDKVNAHLADFENPHQVTKDQVGLGNVDNTSDLDKPVSTATQEALDTLRSDLEGDINTGSSELSKLINDHIANVENPHQVTKAQVGLGNVDNTSDLNKPVSTAQQAAIDLAKSEVSTALTTHIQDKNNPHSVTKAQVGLGNVDNTADLNKPVSVAQQAAIDKISSDLTLALQTHTTNTNNPHQVTAAQIGLGHVNDTADVDKPVSKAQQEAINAVKEELSTKLTDTTNTLTNHINDQNNPHKVTKEQLGLGNVDNTADIDKPISKDTQAALDKKADLVDGLVPETQIPRRPLHSMYYKGIWDADTNTPQLENGTRDQEGDFYIVRNQGLRFGYEFLPNDVVYNADGGWYRLQGSQQRDEATRFEIISFEADQYEFEVGDSATINFSWEYNGVQEGESVDFQGINQYTVENDQRTYQITEITTDTKFTLTAIYGNLNDKAELEVKFYNKFYLGTATGTTASDSDLHKMDSYFDNGKNQVASKVIDCSGGKYIYVAFPEDSLGHYEIYANGILVTDLVETTREVTNASGGKARYVISRFANKYNGSLTVSLRLIP